MMFLLLFPEPLERATVLKWWTHYVNPPGRVTDTLHLELRSVMCNGAEENQAHRCDPYDLRVQEQPLFLVCSSITIFTSMGLDP